MEKIGRLESPVQFITHQALRTLKHPGILCQINPLEVVKAEWNFRKYRLPMTEFVAKTLDCTTEEVRRVLTEITLPDDVQLHKVRECLFAVTRILKPERVVETGVGGGYGSSYILAALVLNNKGRLYSIDSAKYFDPEYFDLPKGMECGGMVPQYLRHHWSLSQGSAEHDLPIILEKLGNIEMFIHDSLHTRANMEFEYDIAWEYLQPGGILISHDIWTPWIDFARKVNRPYTVYQHYGAIVK